MENSESVAISQCLSCFSETILSSAEVGRKGVDFEERCCWATWNDPCSYDSNRLRLCVFDNWLPAPCNKYKFDLYLLHPTAQTIQNIPSSDSLVKRLWPGNHWNSIRSCHILRCSKFLPPVAAHFRWCRHAWKILGPLQAILLGYPWYIVQSEKSSQPYNP